MPDGAISTNRAVQTQLDRLSTLALPQGGPGGGLGLAKMRVLMERLGHPERALPPVLHIAGTNGKGSTAAFLRAMLEADGKRIHAYTSPHLVRFNERIRVTGALIDDAALALLLAEVLDIAGDLGASFFEITTAAAFLAFSRTPADACIVEVGLGGRLDATNVIPAPGVTGIAALGIDHETFLLAEEAGTPSDPMTRIAWEKAGIAKPGAPLVTLDYPAPMRDAIGAQAARAGTVIRARNRDWSMAQHGDGLLYEDKAGQVALPLPLLPGAHQIANLGLAVAMLRFANRIAVADASLRRGATDARWPGRLQRLAPGALTENITVPVWLDGGHNRIAGAALAAHFAGRGRGLTLITGMLANKDAGALIVPLAPCLDRIIGVPVPGHEHHDGQTFAAVAARLGIAFRWADDAARALTAAAEGARSQEILIAGSLYLAGDVLRRNGQIPE